MRRAFVAWLLWPALACAVAPPGTVVIPDISPLVVRASAARGLGFEDPVEVLGIEAPRIPGKLARELDRVASPKELEAQQELARSLGLLPPDTDLRAEILQLQSDTVVGFFTPVDRALYVVTGADGSLPTGAAFESVVVHELVHALQAIHSSVPDVTLGLVDHDDLLFALAAVLEGDATWAMLRDESIQDGLPQRDGQEVARGFEELLGEAGALGTPLWLRESFLRPYPLGYAMAERHAAEAGVAGLDAVLDDPPLTSEELLHPGRSGSDRGFAWLDLELRGIVPDVRCRQGAANTFGEIGLRVWALEAGATPERAAVAADGWDGDRALLAQCPDGPAFVWLVQLDSEADADELESLAAELWGAGPGAADDGTLPAGADSPGAGADRGDRPRVDRAGVRVLLSRGLEESARERLLTLPEKRVTRLSTYLEERPEVEARARALRH